MLIPQALHVRNLEVKRMKDRVGYNTRMDHEEHADTRHPRDGAAVRFRSVSISSNSSPPA